MARAGKTVRFTQVVERSGQPHVHTLWVAPERDPELQRAVKDHRVMTLEPSAHGGNTDLGVVGFDKAHAKEAQFLIFPKSLKRFDGARVVGIKFELVEQPKFAAANELTQVATHHPNRRKYKPTPTEPPKSEERSSAEDQVPTRDAKPIAFEPPPEHRKPPTSKAARSHAKAGAKTQRHADTELVREVRAAVAELKAGKAVAAYERLQRALEQRT